LLYTSEATVIPGDLVHCALVYSDYFNIGSFFPFCFQNVKAYLRRGTAREMLGYYKDAIEGESIHHITSFFE